MKQNENICNRQTKKRPIVKRRLMIGLVSFLFRLVVEAFGPGVAGHFFGSGAVVLIEDLDNRLS